MNKIKNNSQNILSFIENSVLVHGSYVNNSRHMPHLLDGLKPSYRRIIWTTLEEPDKLTKVATLAGICGGKYSPHTPEALPAVVSELVHTKIFVGQGSHGSRNIFKPWSNKPAASRYIEAKLSKGWRKMLTKLIPLVEYKESELDSRYKEPVYIPTPVPLAMMFNILGLGVGLRSTTPNFSIESMIDAHLNNDYKLLKPNGDLILDRKKSELKSLWEKGKGKVVYKYNITKDTFEGISGYSLFGDSRFIQISKLTKPFLNKTVKVKSSKASTKTRKAKSGVVENLGWIDSGKVLMIDKSDRKGNKKIFFSVNPKYTKEDKVSDEELKSELNIIREISSNYDLNVTDGKISKRWPLKLWLEKTYSNFDRLVNTYKSSEIKKIKRKEQIIKYSKPVAELVIKNPKIERSDITKKLNIKDKTLVDDILKKSISVLLKVNENQEIKKLLEQRKEIDRLKTTDLYEDIIAKK